MTVHRGLAQERLLFACLCASDLAAAAAAMSAPPMLGLIPGGVAPPSLAQQLQEEIAELREENANQSALLQTTRLGREKMRARAEAAEQALQQQRHQAPAAAAAGASCAELSTVTLERDAARAQLNDLRAASAAAHQTAEQLRRQLTTEKAVSAAAQTELTAVQQSARGASEASQQDRERCERLTDHLRQVYTPDTQRRVSGQQALSRVTLRDGAPNLTPLHALRPKVTPRGRLVKICYSLPSSVIAGWTRFHTMDEMVTRQLERVYGPSALEDFVRKHKEFSVEGTVTQYLTADHLVPFDEEEASRIPEKQALALYLDLLHRGVRGEQLFEFVYLKSEVLETLVLHAAQYDAEINGGGGAAAAEPAAKRPRAAAGAAARGTFSDWLASKPARRPLLDAWDQLKSCEILINPLGLSINSTREPADWCTDLRILEDLAQVRMFPSLALESAMKPKHKPLEALLHARAKYVPLDQRVERMLAGNALPEPAARRDEREEKQHRRAVPMDIDGEPAAAAPVAAAAASPSPAAARASSGRRGGARAAATAAAASDLDVIYTTGSDLFPPFVFIKDRSQLTAANSKVELKAIFARLDTEVAEGGWQVVPRSYILDPTPATTRPVKSPADVVRCLKNCDISPHASFILYPEFYSPARPLAGCPAKIPTYEGHAMFRVGGVLLAQFLCHVDRQDAETNELHMAGVCGSQPVGHPAWCESQSQFVDFCTHVLQRLEDYCGLVSGMPIIHLQAGAEFKYCSDHGDCTEKELIAQQPKSGVAWQTTDCGFIVRFYLMHAMATLDAIYASYIEAPMMYESSGAIAQLLAQELDAIGRNNLKP